MHSKARAEQEPTGRNSRNGRTAHLVLTAVLIAAGWLGLVANTQRHELIVDACVVALLTLFARKLFQSDWLRLRFQASDVVQCWRIPWYVLSGCREITAVLFRDVFLGHHAGSFFRACSFRISRRDPVLRARSVLTVVYTTTAPNFIVIGIDGEQNQMLFHQIERSSVPEMSQALGAQHGSAS